MKLLRIDVDVQMWAQLVCYCGKTYPANEGYGMFCSRSCADTWRQRGYFDLRDYHDREGR